MKLLFTAKGTTLDSPMDPRFGRTPFFVIFDEETQEVTSYDNRAVENEAHGAGTRTSQKLVELGVEVLITGNGPGGNAASVLEMAETKVFTGAGEMTVQQALDAYREGKLNKI